MKVGFRTPSPSRSIRNATTARAVRAVRSSADPTYGKKGIGFVKDPERAVRNAVYHRVTIGAREIAEGYLAKSEGVTQGTSPCCLNLSDTEDGGYPRGEKQPKVVRGGKAVDCDGITVKLKRGLGSFAGLADDEYAKSLVSLLECFGYKRMPVRSGAWERGACFRVRKNDASSLVCLSVFSGKKLGVGFVRDVVEASAKASAAEAWVICKTTKENELTWQAIKLIDESSNVRIFDGNDVDALLLQEALLRLPFSSQVGSREERAGYESMLRGLDHVQRICKSLLAELDGIMLEKDAPEDNLVREARRNLKAVNSDRLTLKKSYGFDCEIRRDSASVVMDEMSRACAALEKQLLSCSRQVDVVKGLVRNRRDEELKKEIAPFLKDFAAAEATVMARPGGRGSKRALSTMISSAGRIRAVVDEHAGVCGGDPALQVIADLTSRISLVEKKRKIALARSLLIAFAALVLAFALAGMYLTGR